MNEDRGKKRSFARPLLLVSANKANERSTSMQQPSNSTTTTDESKRLLHNKSKFVSPLLKKRKAIQDSQTQTQADEGEDETRNNPLADAQEERENLLEHKYDSPPPPSIQSPIQLPLVLANDDSHLLPANSTQQSEQTRQKKRKRETAEEKLQQVESDPSISTSSFPLVSGSSSDAIRFDLHSPYPYHELFEQYEHRLQDLFSAAEREAKARNSNKKKRKSNHHLSTASNSSNTSVASLSLSSTPPSTHPNNDSDNDDFETIPRSAPPPPQLVSCSPRFPLPSFSLPSPLLFPLDHQSLSNRLPPSFSDLFRAPFPPFPILATRRQFSITATALYSSSRLVSTLDLRVEKSEGRERGDWEVNGKRIEMRKNEGKKEAEKPTREQIETGEKIARRLDALLVELPTTTPPSTAASSSCFSLPAVSKEKWIEYYRNRKEVHRKLMMTKLPKAQQTLNLTRLGEESEKRRKEKEKEKKEEKEEKEEELLDNKNPGLITEVCTVSEECRGK